MTGSSESQMFKNSASKICITVVLFSISFFASGQSPRSPEEVDQTFVGEKRVVSNGKQSLKVCGVKHLDRCFIDLAHDQAGIWSSPFRIKSQDAIWLVPLAGATGAAFYFDTQAQSTLGFDQSRINVSHHIARFGSPYVTFGAGAGIYLLGAISKNPKLSETGRLGAEAVVNALIVAEAFKLVTNRDRPSQGTGSGGFWPQGSKRFNLDSSFPSAHAAGSWALARVIASEYPGTLSKIAAYGFATLISVARVTGGDHFSSDALVGSAFGYLIGGYVYRHHSAGANQENALMIMPDFDQKTHTYGARIEIPAAALLHPIQAVRQSLQ